MKSDRSTAGESGSILRYLPVDLVPAAAAIIIGALIVIADSGSPNLTRIPFTLPLVLFLPGYSLLAALYPRPQVLSTIVRIALSVAFSVAIVPMLSLLLASSPLRFTRESLLGAVAIVSIALLVIAVCRRLLDRSELDTSVTPSGADEAISPQKIGRSASAALLLFAVVILFPVVGSAFSERTERYTEFYLLESNGTPNASTQRPSPTFGAPLTLGIVNHEGREVGYTIVIHLVNGTPNSTAGETGGSNNAEVHRVAVQDGAQHLLQYTPPAWADNSERIDFLLYRDVDLDAARLNSGPVDSETGYRSLFLWLHPARIALPAELP